MTWRNLKGGASNRRTALMTPCGEIWGAFVGRAFISTVGGHYIYKVTPKRFFTLLIFTVETLLVWASIPGTSPLCPPFAILSFQGLE